MESHLSMSNQKYSVIDIETTGMNREGQKIIEIAIINYDADTDTVVETFSSLINPEKNISYQIEMITGINDEMVEDAPKFYQLAKKIIEMTEGRVFVAHNVFFDYRFIQREFIELGYTYKRNVFCTCKSARVAFKGLASYSLKNLCHHFGFTQKAAHRALSDAEDALLILKKILNSNVDIETLSSDDHLIPAQLQNFSFEDFPETYGLYFMYAENNELLYVGKSKNIRSRLRQHFKMFKGEKREKSLKSEVVRVEFLECFHDLPTSLLELHLIKNLHPKYNRAQRKKVFRYGVRKETNETGLLELKTTTSVADLPLSLTFGSKKTAMAFVEKTYEKCFGINPNHPLFKNQIQLFAKTLGLEKFNHKIETYLSKFDSVLEDQLIGDEELWQIKIEDNRLTSLFVKGQPTFKIDETPDMRLFLNKKISLFK